MKVISKGIKPDLIKRVNDLNIKSSDYDNFKIVGHESIEGFVSENVWVFRYSNANLP
jgi:hypothetical protein